MHLSGIGIIKPKIIFRVPKMLSLQCKLLQKNLLYGIFTDPLLPYNKLSPATTMGHIKISIKVIHDITASVFSAPCKQTTITSNALV